MIILQKGYIKVKSNMKKKIMRLAKSLLEKQNVKIPQVLLDEWKRDCYSNSEIDDKLSPMEKIHEGNE